MEHLLIKSAKKESIERIPVWIMRQAGRYLKEYREIREKYDFFTMCKTPNLAVKVSMQPIDILDVDAGIIFSDILIPVEAMGIKVTFEKDHGPKLHNPISNYSDVEKLIIPEPEKDMPFVGESIKLFKKELNNRKPVIGFSGAPWTLASYMIEGGGSKNHLKIKSMMINDPRAFSLLMEKLTETVIKHLYSQIKAGSDLVQLFDTWAGVLSPKEYNDFVFPYQKRIIQELKKLSDVPISLYINNSGNILEKMSDTGADVISLDWMIDIAKAKKVIGDKVSIQGNLDPCYLFGEPEFVKQKTLDILNIFGKNTGYIFNLGHGILPNTPVENVKLMVETVINF